MDRFEAMQLFVRVVERCSFTLAAHDTGIPRSTVTQVIKQLEERLGVRLLQRTTRVVRPTLDGEAYYKRCLNILADIEDAEGVFSGSTPKGMLRIEVQGTIARHFLMPALPTFFEHYPYIEVSMSESDRWVDVVHEGVDCVLRYGALPDSDMIARPLATLERLTCATPAYLERFGIPKTLEELASGHRMVGIRSITTGNLTSLEFKVGSTYQSMILPSPFSVTGPESYLAGICLGLGLAQVPRFHIENELKNKTLIPILTDWPPPSAPVSIVYPRNRQLSPRVRVFIDWAIQEFAKKQQDSTSFDA